MTAEVRIRLTGQVEHLRFAWQAGEALLETVPFTDDPEGTRYNILLATQEMLTNVLRHAYGLDADKPIDVVFRTDGESFAVELRDCGPAFDPLAHCTEDVESDEGMPMSEGGFGIHIAKVVMDELTYRREDEWNVLAMVKGVGVAAGVPAGDHQQDLREQA